MPLLIDHRCSGGKQRLGVYKPVGDGEWVGLVVAAVEDGRRVSRRASRATSETSIIAIHPGGWVRQERQRRVRRRPAWHGPCGHWMRWKRACFPFLSVIFVVGTPG